VCFISRNAFILVRLESVDLCIDEFWSSSAFALHCSRELGLELGCDYGYGYGYGCCGAKREES